MDEKELFHKVRKGDEKAFEILFNQYYGILCAVAEAILHNTEAAEDIVQEAFSKLWIERDSINIDTSLKAFLIQWIKNRCFNYLDHLEVIFKHKRDIIHSADVNYEEYENPDDDLIASIYASVQQLPPQCQKVFKLSRFDGLKQKEIADKLGISVKTVKIHIGKALLHIRQSVKKM